MAYGSPQARDPVRAAAAGLHLSHSNAGSKPHLPPTPQLKAKLDPHWVRPGIKLHILMWFLTHLATMGTPFPLDFKAT